MEIGDEINSAGQPRFRIKKMETSEDASDIVFEEPRRTRGRPKEEAKTAIGLPKTPTLQPFHKKSDAQKARLMLSLVMKSGSSKNVMSFSYKLRLSDINHLKTVDDLPHLYASDVVDVGMLEQYMEKDAFKRMKQMQSLKKKKISLCPDCKKKTDNLSLECVSCLSWYHKKCVKSDSRAKNGGWIHKICKTNQF
ncbi:hypothetical protein QAD02_000799 [Eretmocerus hayati]|uniref:Uncharacterized protein n=1 Tax=Eretmocerus hayati TaxID=131215 RepID=A0ACC2NJ12_9HYME|nr:hypothetical protein QAD02_000799 [Eretmocerus hayati]